MVSQRTSWYEAQEQIVEGLGLSRRGVIGTGSQVLRLRLRRRSARPAAAAVKSLLELGRAEGRTSHHVNH